MCMFFFFPFIPKEWDERTTDEEITVYLREIARRQSPGIKYLQDRIKSQDGRDIVFVCIDATDLPCESSADALLQMARYSGPRGKGHCVFQTTLTCPAGAVLALAPGNLTNLHSMCAGLTFLKITNITRYFPGSKSNISILLLQF